MERQTLVAIGLSVVVIWTWSLLFPPPKPPVPEQTETTTSAETSAQTPLVTNASPSLTKPPALPTQSLSNESQVSYDAQNASATPLVIETPLYKATVSPQGGVLTSFLLKDYQHAKDRVSLGDWVPFLKGVFGKSKYEKVTENNLVQMIQKGTWKGIQAFGVHFKDHPELTQAFNQSLFASNQESFTLEQEGSSKKLTLTSAPVEGLQVIKEFIFHADSFVIDYALSVSNRSEQNITLDMKQIFTSGRVPESLEGGPSSSYGHVGAVYFTDGDVETEDADDLAKEFVLPTSDWLGVEDLYFISAARATSMTRYGFFEAMPDLQNHERLEPFYGMRLPQTDLGPGQQMTSSFVTYLGPKDDNQMVLFGKKLEMSHDMTLAVVAQPLLALLRYIHGYVGNYGVAIIILTVIVRLLLFPLAYKGMRSMKRMQQLQPKMKKLQEKYKDDRQRMNQELLELYRKHKVNPMGGCLPLIMQVPIFFGLYSALSLAVELRHAPFYSWITDLSAPDGLGITPVLMGVSMFLLQKMSPNPMMDPTQAKIMNMLPVIFTVFTFTFPAGLTIYWTTSNLLSMVQQYIINNSKVPELEDHSVAKKSGGKPHKGKGHKGQKRLKTT